MYDVFSLHFMLIAKCELVQVQYNTYICMIMERYIEDDLVVSRLGLEAQSQSQVLDEERGHAHGHFSFAFLHTMHVCMDKQIQTYYDSRI